MPDLMFKKIRQIQMSLFSLEVKAYHMLRQQQIFNRPSLHRIPNLITNAED